MVFIYNTLFVLISGYLLEGKLKQDKQKKRYLFVCFLQMFLIQGLRHADVGTDTSYYVTVYERFTNSEYYSFLFTHFEVGFQTVYTILKSINADAQILLLLVSGVTMINFAYFIYKNSDSVWLSTFIFACMFYPNSFNIMRQYLAVSIAINAFQFFMENKYVKASIIIIIASLFHMTALILFVPMILYKVKNWKLSRNLILACSCVVLVFGDQIVKIALELLSKSFYLTGFEVNRLFRMTTMLTLLFSVLTWYFMKKNQNDEYKNYFNLFTCIAFINLNVGLLYLRYEFFSRIIEILNLFLIISFPLAIRQIRSYYRPIIKLGTIMVPFLLMINTVFNSGSGIENYKMFFMQ